MPASCLKSQGTPFPNRKQGQRNLTLLKHKLPHSQNAGRGGDSAHILPVWSTWAAGVIALVVLFLRGLT